MGYSQSRICRARHHALEEEIISKDAQLEQAVSTFCTDPSPSQAYARMLHSDGGSFEIFISGAENYEVLERKRVQVCAYPCYDDYYTVRGRQGVLTQLAFVAPNVNARVTLYEVRTTYSAWGSDLRGSVPAWAKVLPLETLKKVVVEDMEKKFGSEFRKLVLERCMHAAAENESADAEKKESAYARSRMSRFAGLGKNGGGGFEKLPSYAA
ncbi:hypothetical protein SLS56_001057 [Neofusicoccum ribis]|uniref:Uncharacterized protein n=1 Tax=Neofusicoccum ribis TaxID=45134 RepID=A0ABR3TAS6_9PEZI